jgi:protein-disulfide isomerase
LIRLSVRFASALALGALTLPVVQAAAQQDAPAASAPEAAEAAPSAPAPSGAPVFSKPDPANFTAALPSKETANAFLHANWGFDTSRVWQVQAILKTPAEGVSKVIVMVADKAGKQKPGQLAFFVLPDQKHIIVIGDDSVVPFGEHPFAEARAMLQQRADGPYRGSAAKDLEIVEFADFECPHCKAAQANMDKLAVDFPKARIVFQFYPLESIHPQAKIASAYGLCVAKQGGSTAFFPFAAAVFDGQEGLATADGATLTLNSAVTKAGLEPAKVAACAATPAVLDAVEASKKLAEDLNINQTPMLAINGRMIPANAAYDTIKQVIEYQAKMDGVQY